MTPTQKRIASEMLELASEEFSNHGCNDYELPDTPDNRAFITAMNEADDDLDDEDKEPMTYKGKICVADWLVMDYLAKLLKEESESL